MRKIYHLLGPAVVQPIWPKFLSASLVDAVTIGLITARGEEFMSSRALNVNSELNPCLVAEQLVREWPGSRLVYDEHATLRLYTFNEVACAVVVGAARSLYEWLNPYLPQDLHLLRGDGSILLASITTHDTAWLELSDDEYESLVERLPILRPYLREPELS